MKWCSFPFPPMKTPGFGDVFVFLQPKPKEGVFVLQGMALFSGYFSNHTQKQVPGNLGSNTVKVKTVSPQVISPNWVLISKQLIKDIKENQDLGNAIKEGQRCHAQLAGPGVQDYGEEKGTENEVRFSLILGIEFRHEIPLYDNK